MWIYVDLIKAVTARVPLYEHVHYLVIAKFMDIQVASNVPLSVMVLQGISLRLPPQGE